MGILRNFLYKDSFSNKGQIKKIKEKIHLSEWVKDIQVNREASLLKFWIRILAVGKHKSETGAQNIWIRTYSNYAKYFYLYEDWGRALWGGARCGCLCVCRTSTTSYERSYKSCVVLHIHIICVLLFEENRVVAF